MKYILILVTAFSINQYGYGCLYTIPQSDTIKKVPVEEAVQFLRKEYIGFMNDFPTDTVGILNLLLDEIEMTRDLTNEQRESFQLIVKDSLARGTLLPYIGEGIPLYSADISSIIKLFLAPDEYLRFAKVRASNSVLATKYSNFLYIYLRREKGVSDQLINSELRKLIYGH